MYFDWKTLLEQIQLTRELKNDTIFHQKIRLPCKNHQGHCDSTSRPQAIILWFPEDSSTTFQVAKNHAKMKKLPIFFYSFYTI